MYTSFLTRVTAVIHRGMTYTSTTPAVLAPECNHDSDVYLAEPKIIWERSGGSPPAWSPPELGVDRGGRRWVDSTRGFVYHSSPLSLSLVVRNLCPISRIPYFALPTVVLAAALHWSSGGYFSCWCLLSFLVTGVVYIIMRTSIVYLVRPERIYLL